MVTFPEFETRPAMTTPPTTSTSAAAQAMSKFFLDLGALAIDVYEDADGFGEIGGGNSELGVSAAIPAPHSPQNCIPSVTGCPFVQIMMSPFHKFITCLHISGALLVSIAQRLIIRRFSARQLPTHED
jgi:hypothetical protein